MSSRSRGCYNRPAKWLFASQIIGVRPARGVCSRYLNIPVQSKYLTTSRKLEGSRTVPKRWTTPPAEENSCFLQPQCTLCYLHYHEEVGNITQHTHTHSHTHKHTHTHTHPHTHTLSYSHWGTLTITLTLTLTHTHTLSSHIPEHRETTINAEMHI